MECKFAVLEYASKKEDYINKNVLAIKSKKLHNWYVKKKMPILTEQLIVLGVEGIKVILPLTADNADSDEGLKNEVYERTLDALKNRGVKAVKSIHGAKYEYDYILPAASGFYILPFILSIFLKKANKILDKNLSNVKILILDGILDLTLDILCIITDEVNHISILTESTDFLKSISDRFYYDSGLNIHITDNKNDFSINEADIILSASPLGSKYTNRYKKGAIFFDMIGNKEAVSAISSRRADMVVIDGLQFKCGNSYIDNVLLETICIADNESFLKYIYGDNTDKVFYDVFDYVDNLNLAITAFLLFGKNTAIVNGGK